MRARTNVGRLAVLGVAAGAPRLPRAATRSRRRTAPTTPANTGPVATTVPAADLNKFVPNTQPGRRRRQEADPGRGHHDQDEPDRRQVRPVRRRPAGLLRHDQRPGRDLRPQARDRQEPRRHDRPPEQPAGAGEPLRRQRVRHVRRDLQFTGADLLAKAKQPTFIWNINPEMATPRAALRTTTSSGRSARCASRAAVTTCRGSPSRRVHEGRRPRLQQGDSASSACADGTRASYQKYAPSAKVVFFDDSLQFAADITADVTHMKEKGVQFIFTCMDTNEVTKLAKEMKKQGLNAVQQLPERLRPRVHRRERRDLRGQLHQPAVRAVGGDAAVAGHEGVPRLHRRRTSHPRSSSPRSAGSWVRMFLDGLKLAGPEFTQAEGHRRARTRRRRSRRAA